MSARGPRPSRPRRTRRRPTNPKGTPAVGTDEGRPSPLRAPSSVRVSVDKVNLNPHAMATGTVVFSDGVTGKWIVDLQGRPGLTDVSKPGYRPNPADAQAFMQELSVALQGA